MRYRYLGNVSNGAELATRWSGDQGRRGGRLVVVLGFLVAALHVAGVAGAVHMSRRRGDQGVVHSTLGRDILAATATVRLPAKKPPALAGPSPVATLAQATTPDGRPTVALTFDDGPDPRWTPAVLQILREEGVVATFCTVGTSSAAHPDLVRAEAAQGHAACNHTAHHDGHLDRRPLPDIASEVNGQADTLRSILGADPPYYRAPGGNLSPAMVDIAHQRGMRVLHWSADVADFRPNSPTAMTQTMLAFVRPGAIILLHDGGGDRSGTVAMLRPLIQQLKARGYVFVLP
ncbi:MAG: polysaccharide deacetylase family protein [Actinomycetota bacterium]|nr:polysaccharide deacetylase family protein [Actinomycetota bacterium]